MSESKPKEADEQMSTRKELAGKLILIGKALRKDQFDEIEKLGEGIQPLIDSFLKDLDSPNAQLFKIQSVRLSDFLDSLKKLSSDPSSITYGFIKSSAIKLSDSIYYTVLSVPPSVHISSSRFSFYPEQIQVVQRAPSSLMNHAGEDIKMYDYVSAYFFLRLALELAVEYATRYQLIVYNHSKKHFNRTPSFSHLIDIYSRCNKLNEAFAKELKQQYADLCEAPHRGTASFNKMPQTYNTIRNLLIKLCSLQMPDQNPELATELERKFESVLKSELPKDARVYASDKFRNDALWNDDKEKIKSLLEFR